MINSFIIAQRISYILFLNLLYFSLIILTYIFNCPLHSLLDF